MYGREHCFFIFDFSNKQSVVCTHIHKAIMEVKSNQRSRHSRLRLDSILNRLSHDRQKVWAAFIVEISGEFGPHTQTHHQKADHEQTWVATKLSWSTTLHLYQQETLINLLGFVAEYHPEPQFIAGFVCRLLIL